MFGATKNNQFIGVDIGESAIKLVQLGRSGKTFTVQNFAIEPLHRGLFVEGQILDADQIGTLIHHALAQHKFTAKQAVSAVNYTDIISKRLMVRTDLHDRELEQWIEFEVDKFVPFPVTDLNIDYHFVGQEAGEFEREVQVVACRKNTINNIENCLEVAGLEPVAVDIAHTALSRAGNLVVHSMAGGGMSDLTAMVDIGTSSTRFYVYSGEEMVYQRDEPFGAGILLDDIAAEYSMPEEKAHMAIYKKQLPSSYREKVLKPYIKLMLKEIERGIQSCEASGIDGQIARVLIAGGSARVGGLEKIVHKRIRLDVRLMNPLSLLRTARKIDAANMRSQAPQLATACGLAMWAQA